MTLACGAVLAPQDSLRYWTGGLFGISRRQWVAAWLLGLVFAAGPEWGVTVAPTQESLNLIQQVACSTYVLAGLALLAWWALGSAAGRPDRTGPDGPACAAVSWSAQAGESPGASS